MQANQPLNVGIIYATEHANDYERQGITERNIDALITYTCGTEAEMAALLQGIDEASGWSEFNQEDDDEVKARGLNPNLSVVVSFDGDSEAYLEEDAEGDSQAEEFTFATEAEKKAFERGLEHGIGWMNYVIISEESLDAYNSALAFDKKQPVVSSFKIDLENGESLMIATYRNLQEVRAELEGLLPYIKAITSIKSDEYLTLDHRPCDDSRLQDNVRDSI